MYDFVIIGGGIIGMSTAMQLIDVYPDARIALLEKESAPACHQTGHNSGVIHAGVYYTPGSLKARFCLAGNQATKTFCDQNNIRYDTCGKMLVATSELEMARMRALWERTAANGLEREWLSAAELREREPNIIGLGGIFVPSSGIVSYRDVATAMANRFQAKGGEIIYHAEVSALTEHAAGIVIRTSQGREIETATLIGCAGLMADRLVKMLGVEPGFIICPFRGEYFRLAPRHNRIVNHLIYPIPDPAMPFLGVHLTRMIDGSVTVGPNAVLALKREGYRKRDVSFTDTLEIFRSAGIRRVLQNHLLSGLGEMKNSLCKSGYLRRVQKYCPSLTVNDLQPWPAGVRALAELARRAGIPAGVFNVVTGSAGDIGGELTSNPLVRKLSFTGSTEIGRQLMEQCAKDIKKVSLELGGNAPFIVFDDADLDKAVEGALASKFRNAGQTCVCANRLYVQDGVYDRFAEKLNQAVNKLAVGDGLQADVAIGPLIDEKAVAKVQEHIADALEKGARVITGGEAHKLGGNFFQPTILADVPDNAKVAKEETFGPLAPLFRFSDEADVIRQANDTEFGLAAYFYARDLSRVFRVGEALEYGIVGINTGIISNEVAPFGGIKASGLGREGSKYGIEDYLEIKYMCIGL
ncbi:L-2-hydroxyglutarate oxidase [Salmonella enterica]|nr:L-2-hydroxyglutarate oxidase [Salmonella enterica subsp. enterica serovar Dublin]